MQQRRFKPMIDFNHLWNKIRLNESLNTINLKKKLKPIKFISKLLKFKLGVTPMLPLTLGLLVYSLFMRVGCSVCVTLPLIIYHLSLTRI